jgi:hypothetical protein
MASPNPGERPVTDSTVIRAVLPRNPVKRLARLLGVPFETAKHWTYREVSVSRRRELALALLAEMDEQEVARGAIRRRLAIWAGDLPGDADAGEAETDRAGGARGVGAARTEKDGLGGS